MAPQYCGTCKQDVEAEVDEAEGHSFCPICGLQLEDLVFESGVSFIKSGDSAHVAGSLIREDMLGRAGGAAGGGYGDDSRDRSIGKGRHHIMMFADQLGIPRPQEYIQQATRLYQLAVGSGFTRGRRTNQVAAACLYIVLRQDNQPFMLIDFCNLLRVNVYVLGATFLRLAEKLRFDKHPVFCRPIDPSLFLHRFAGRLKLGNKVTAVIETAMQLVAQMKRDWLQTGRRPAGVCGAALWVAAHIHGFALTRKDVIKVVSVGESTIQHRIHELRGTDASDMTLTEFHEHSKLFYQETHKLLESGPEPKAVQPADGADAPRLEAPPLASGATCREVTKGEAPAFAMGMCRDCYTAYLNSSGGIWKATQDPPAYTRNLRKQVQAHRAGAKRSRVDFLEGRDDDGGSQSGIAEHVGSEFTLAVMDGSMQPLLQALPTRDDMPGEEEVTAARAQADFVATTNAKLNAISTVLDEPAPSKRPNTAPPPPASSSREPSEQSRALTAVAEPCEIPPELGLELCTIPDDIGLSEEQRRQAIELSQLNAAPVLDEPEPEKDDEDAAPDGDDAGPSTSGRKVDDGDGGGGEDGDEDEEEGNADKADGALAVASTGKEVVPVNVESLSDVDDEEIENCIASAEEVEIKKSIWQHLNKDWEHAQAAKAAAHAAAKATGVELNAAGKKKRGRPGARPKPKATFTAGESAMESVQRMLAAKNLTSKVNLTALESFFEETEALAKGEVSVQELQEKEAPRQQPPAREESRLHSSQRSEQHMNALLREGDGVGAGILGGLGPGDVRNTGRRVVRLGRL